MVACIYALVEPFSGLIRYIGKTTQTLPKRMWDHWYRLKSGKKTHCYDWLRSLIKEGHGPDVVVIQDGFRELEELNSAEKHWISYFKNVQKMPLTNHTAGGDGGVMDASTRKKVSDSRKGKGKWSEERRRKASERMKGTNNPFYGRKHSEESKCKMSASSIGGINQHTRKTHCKNGHEFTPENTYRCNDGGRRHCLICKRKRGREFMRKYNIKKRLEASK